MLSNLLQKAIFWSDSRPLYFVTAWSLFVLLLILAAFPIVSVQTKANGKRFWKILFCVLLGLFIILGRWPGLFYQTAYNVDEAQIVSNARTLVFDPVFFRSVDGASSGPAVVYPLLIPRIFGTGPNYFTSRLVGLVMLAIAVILLYLGLRRPAGEFAARIGVLGTASFLAFTNFWDFVHYSSEHAPIFFIVIGTFFVLRIAFRSEINGSRVIIEGVLGAIFLSLVLLAKLQAIYLALFVGGCLLIAVTYRLQSRPGTMIAGVSACIISAFCIPIGFTIWMWKIGTLDYFIKSYFGNALVYQKEGQNTFGIEIFWKVLTQTPDMLCLMMGFGAYFLAALIFTIALMRWTVPARRWVLLLFALGFVLLSYYSVIVPHRDYLHYLLFMPFGMAVFVVAVTAILNASPVLGERVLAGMLVLLTWIVPVVTFHIVRPNPWAGSAYAWIAKPLGFVESKILDAAGNSNHVLCVWGYMPYYYVSTGLRQATRLSTVSAQFNNNKYQEFFRRTFLQDLKKSKPGVFVDAVAPGNFFLNSPERYAHENVPEVSAWVSKHYQLYTNVNGVRIYRWKSQ